MMMMRLTKPKAGHCLARQKYQQMKLIGNELEAEVVVEEKDDFDHFLLFAFFQGKVGHSMFV